MRNLPKMIVERLRRFAGMGRVDNAITRNSRKLKALGERLQSDEKEISQQAGAKT